MINLIKVLRWLRVARVGLSLNGLKIFIIWEDSFLDCDVASQGLLVLDGGLRHETEND